MRLKKINILGGVEKVGNALPHPAALFGIFGLITLVISLIGFLLQWEGVNPGIGSLIATMLPYSITFFIVWSLLIIGWILLGLPLGPEAGLYYTI